MRTSSVLVSFIAAALTLPCTLSAQAPNQASAQLVTHAPHFHSGEDVSFVIKLNEPLPEGATFNVRLSPVDADQQLFVSSGEPSDKDRKEFLLKFKVPEHARGGEWHISVVYLFLSGASWVGNTIRTDDMRFYVDGSTAPLPSSATATFVKQ